AFDGVDFTNFQSVGLGEATVSLAEHGNYDPYIDLHNLGIGREMLVEIVQTDPVPHVLTHGNLTVKELGQ
ncbi:MAG: hypothetical protein ACR2NF_05725, partial [Pirellulales bacterium]